MIWGYITLFFFSTVKFITAPFFGLAIPGNTVFVTWLVVVSGGMFGVTFFYLLSDFFMKRAQKRIVKKGIVVRKFTRMNKLAVKLKQTIGIYGLALLTASFLSIPLGSIITAKFFGHEKKTIFILYIAVFLVGSLVTFAAYLF